jgi:enoyl-CoA hydratase/carnithine racemase
MQLPTDVRIASKSSRFGFVFAKRGIVPDGCASWFLPKIVGIPMALELCYSGKIIDSSEALRIGLVNYVVEDNELLTKAIEISDLFCNSSAPVSVAMTRHMLWSLSADSNPENSHIIESKLINSRGASEDAKEGVMSFLEKRDADFKNKISSDLPPDFPWRESQFNDEG